MITLKQFIQKEVLVLLLLLFIFSNPFALVLKCSILFFFLLVWSIFRTFNPLNDRGVFYLFMFSLSYEILSIFGYGDVKTYSKSISGVFMPMMIYMVGRCIVLRYFSEKNVYFMLLYITVIFSVIPILTVLLAIYQDGFTTGSRNVAVPLWGGDVDFSATLLGGYLTIGMASVAALIVNSKSRFERKVVLFLFIVFILSFICALRIGSRTQVGIVGIVLFIAFLYNFSYFSLKYRMILVFSFVMLCLLGYSYFEANPDFLLYYADRLNDDDTSITQAGGRLERWTVSLDYLSGEGLLFGWRLDQIGYAHNLWLDVARESGVIPFIFLIVFTMFNMKLVLNLLFSLRFSRFLKTYIGMVFIGIYLVFFVEPILNGFYYLFLVYCMLSGMLSEIVKQGRLMSSKRLVS